MITTVGKELVKDALPAAYRSYAEEAIDGKRIGDLMTDLAKKDPGKYNDTLQKLNNIGRNVATTYGREASISLKDLTVPASIRNKKQELKQRIHLITNSTGLTSEQKLDEITKVTNKASKNLSETVYRDLLARNNSMARQIESGSRGNKTQLMQTVFGDMLMADSTGKTIPFPGLDSYGSGVSPLPYWLGAQSSRKGMCLAGSTLVRMADFSVKAIKDITKGERVIGADTEGNTFPVEVIDTFDNGERKVNDYTFRVGRMDNLVTLTATENHKVLSVIKNGQATPHLRIPSKLPLSQAWRCFGMTPAGTYQCKAETSQPYARLLGLLLGDGHLSEKYSVTLSSIDVDLIEKLNKDLNNVQLKHIKRNRTSGEPSLEYVVIGKGIRDQAKHRNPIKRWLDTFGLLGTHSHTKFIPEESKRWSNADIANLIHGLYESDGWCRKGSNTSNLPGVGWSMSSEILLNQLKELLQTRFGIYTTTVSPVKLSKTRSFNKSGKEIIHRLDMYTLRVTNESSIYKFNKLLAYGRKSDEFRELLSKHTPNNRDDSLVFGYTGKSDSYKINTYDLSVNHPDHLFVLANGMVVSNSDTQFSTAESGYLSKQLTNVAHRNIVTMPDCGVTQGLKVEGDDSDNVGSILLQPVGTLKAGTIIQAEHLPLMTDKKVTVRSPLTCEAPEGVCQQCTGVREKGTLPDIGEAVGINAVRSFVEALTQSGLGSKHIGGVGGKDEEEVGLTGFKEVNQFVQVPKEFVGGAILSEADGKVAKIQDAPQGGKYIMVSGKQYHIPRELHTAVKIGDNVEAGDVLSNGVPNPSEIVKYKGIGSGRRYFMEQYHKILKKNGAGTNRRNLELFARSFISKIKINDPEGYNGHMVGDVVDYDYLASRWQPREGSKLKSVTSASNLYLEKPYLHYSIGTRITPKVSKELRSNGVGLVATHPKPPPFEPFVVRAQDFTQHDKDWMTRLGGENLKRSTLGAAARGGTSERKSTSYYPAITNIGD